MQQVTSVLATTQFSLAPLLHPKSSAVVGCSSNRATAGNAAFANLPHPKSSLSQRDFFSLINSDKSDKTLFDQLIISVKAGNAQNVLQNAGKAAKSAVLITAGFEEVGNQLDFVPEIPVQGPNCVGNYLKGANSVILKGFKPRKQLKYQIPLTLVVSSSGAFATQIAKQLPNCYFVSVGNQKWLGIEDFLQSEINNYQQFVVYGDSIKNIVKFNEIVQQNPNKQFIIFQHDLSNKQIRQQLKQHSGDNEGIKTNKQENIVFTNSLDQTMRRISIQKEDELHAVCSSGFIATKLLHGFNIQQFDKETKDSISEYLSTGGIPVKSGETGVLDTSVVGAQQFSDLTKLILQKSQRKVIVDILPEMFDEDDLLVIKQNLEPFQDRVIFVIEHSPRMQRFFMDAGFLVLY